MNQNERNEKIEEYGRGFDLFNSALTQIPREAWEFKPAPGEWSIHETVIHMADSETMGALRARKLIAEPGSTLMPYEDAIWARELNYGLQSVDEALEFFRLARLTTYRLIKTVPDRVFANSVVPPGVVHPEYGELYTLGKWLNIYTGHIRDHIEQLQKNHQAWKEQDK